MPPTRLTYLAVPLLVGALITIYCLSRGELSWKENLGAHRAQIISSFPRLPSVSDLSEQTSNLLAAGASEILRHATSFATIITQQLQEVLTLVRTGTVTGLHAIIGVFVVVEHAFINLIQRVNTATGTWARQCGDWVLSMLWIAVAKLLEFVERCCISMLNKIADSLDVVIGLLEGTATAGNMTAKEL